MDVNEHDPKVSMLVVTLDRADVLTRCLESLASQSCPPYEVVLVAGSGTSVPDVLLVKHPELRIVRCQCSVPNISIARNIGLEHAEGEVVIFVDDDAQAHTGLVEAYLEAFRFQHDAWVAGGVALDSRQDPPTLEFACGLIRPSGVQIEVRDPKREGIPRGFRRNVKGCNFAIHRGRLPADLCFDPFFAFAFDETDLIMRVHERAGGVIHVPAAVVDHAHAPGQYRSNGPMDRDWRTEFASHTMFMLKHSQGRDRTWGWCVVWRRLCAHCLRLLGFTTVGRLNPRRAWQYATDAVAGIRHARLSHDSDRSSR